MISWIPESTLPQDQFIVRGMSEDSKSRTKNVEGPKINADYDEVLSKCGTKEGSQTFHEAVDMEA